MKELCLLSIIPFVLIQTIYGAGIEFSKDPNNKAKTGQSFDVLCSLSADTPSASQAVFEWYDRNQYPITVTDSRQPIYVRDVDQGKRLNFLDIKDDDGGIYKCIATVNTQEYEASYQLTIEASLTFSNCNPSQSGILGQQGVVACTAKAGGMNIDASWDKDGQPIRGEARYMIDAKSITILNVTKADAGQYLYTARTKKENKRQEINFKVLIPPKITAPILEQTAVVGNSSKLFCTATGEPMPEILWFKEGTTSALRTTDRLQVSSTKISKENSTQGTLEFLNVQKEDEARYTCNASSTAGSVVTSNKLIVHTPPTIDPIEPNPTSGNEGSSQELKCVSHGDPVPNMIWQKEGTDIQYTSGNGGDGISAVKVDLGDPNNPGSSLILQFSNLKDTHAGEYRCTATNRAGTISASAKLEVRFSPSFAGTQTGPFYNWYGNTDGVVSCIARGNPQPVFTWFKEDTQIRPEDAFYSINNDEDPEVPYKYISNLKVTYNGGNEGVFGNYKCKAVNIIGEKEQVLSMQKAEKPGKPQVTTHLETATKFIFWLYEPTVIGPEITHFRVVYQKKGGVEGPQTQTIAKEYRDHIDFDRKYTVLTIEQLEDSTEYVWTFYAINAVGEGTPTEVTIATPAISMPGLVDILSDANSPYPTSINVRWDKPTDGGAVILKYTVEYQLVNVKSTNGTLDQRQGYELQNPIDEIQIIDNIKNTQVDIKNLLPGSFYLVKVNAWNKEGASSSPSFKIFKTKEALLVPGASTGESAGLSTGAIIGIVVAIFFILFIIVDVTCYFRNNCGILMSIREKFGGSHGEEGYSAAKTDDVENLAKKDELTEEAKAAEESDAPDTADDEKKEPLLLPGEQKVDTVDETDSKPEKEPEEKELKKAPESPTKAEEAPAPAEPPKAETPATPTPAPVEKPSADTNKPQE